MSILFLTNEEFSIKEVNSSQLLCCDIKGFFLCLLYSTECPHCDEMIQIFKNLPGTIGGCQFGVINVSKNKKVIIDSMKTENQIKYVPMCILYHNGIPRVLYKGPRNIQAIQKFVVEVAEKLSKESFSNKKSQENSKQSFYDNCTRVDNYLCNGDVCYFSDVYDVKK